MKTFNLVVSFVWIDVNPNEGTVEDCHGLLTDDVDENAVDANDETGDEEVDEVLDEAGVGDITDDEAAAPTEI